MIVVGNKNLKIGIRKVALQSKLFLHQSQIVRRHNYIEQVSFQEFSAVTTLIYLPTLKPCSCFTSTPTSRSP